MYSAYYEGQNDNYIGFTQGLKENVDVHVTYDGTGSRKIQVNGKEIYVVKDKEITSFYYEDNGCIITLSSTEKELELIKILKKLILLILSISIAPLYLMFSNSTEIEASSNDNNSINY